MEGKDLRGPLFKRFADIVHEELPAGCDYQSVWDSLRHLAGTVPTAKLLHDLAHRLAGNTHNLQARRAVVPWSYQQHWEWVPLVVSSVRRAKSPTGRFGVKLYFRVVAGTPCTLTAEKFWTGKQAAFMSKYFGFSRPPSPKANTPPPYPYLAPEQFTTLRAYGLIDPHKSGADVGPVFDKMRFPPSVIDFNREQFRHRNRGRGYECPRRFPLTQLCHLCPIGYEECRAGCHAKTYATKDCPLCKQAAPFDPEQNAPFCVNCTNNAVYKKD